MKSEIMKVKLGIIGYGVVGKAAEKTFSKFYEVIKYDKYKSLDDFSKLNEADMVFIMVPTPFDTITLSSDDFAVIESLHKLEEINFDSSKPVIIKSTVIPGSCNKYLSNFNLEIVFNPEFLRESTTPFEDFENQHTVVLGTDNSSIFDKIKRMYERVLNKDTKYFQTSPITAEMVKISQNVTLASRVSIANIIYEACSEFGADYDKLVEIAFDRFDILGPHMVKVPGPDGKKGFGGKCLPKDISAFNSLYRHDILDKIIKYNKSLRDDLEN